MKQSYIIFITLFLVLLFGCSSKDNEDKTVVKSQSVQNNNNFSNKTQEKGKDFDACDCNKRSQKILNKTLNFRLQFASIEDLKKNKDSKREIKKFAKEYVQLTAKCFEVNNSRLMVESDCNNLRLLQTKKDSLRSLGIQIEQGESIKLWALIY